MSAPQITSLAALLKLLSPSILPQDIKAKIIKTSIKTPELEEKMKGGVINISKFLSLSEQID